MVKWLAVTSVDPLPESSVVADTNLNIILSHLALEALAEVMVVVEGVVVVMTEVVVVLVVGMVVLAVERWCWW